MIRDYCCREFDGIVKSMEGKPSQYSCPRMSRLAKLLDELWHEYGQYIIASYHDGTNINELGKTMSSFGHSLRVLSWLPTRSPGISPLLKGTDLYQDSAVNRRVLHHHVPYLAVELANSDLVKHLGVNVDVSEERLLRYLQQWATPSGGEPFCTSIKHMRNVYLNLHRKSAEYALTAEGNFIVEAFRTGELVFVPLANTNWKHNRRNDVSGHFYSVHRVCWRDRTTILYSEEMDGREIPSHLPRVLSSYYHYGAERDVNDLIRTAFCHFGVEEDLKIQNLIDILEYNASHNPSPETRDVELFRNIADVVVATIYVHPQSFGPPGDYMAEEQDRVMNQNLADYFLGKIKNLKVFPSQGKKWVTLKGLFVNDKDEIARKFAKTEEIHFLQWPSGKSKKHGPELPNDFTQLCNMPQVSCCASFRVTPRSQVRQSDELREMLYHMIPLIQRYLFSKHSEMHDQLERHQGIAEYLENLQVLSILELKGLYGIKVDGKEYVSEEIAIKGCSLQDDSSTLYVVTDTSGQFTNKMSLVDVFLQMFFHEVGDTSEARYFLNDLVVNNPQSEDAKSEIVQRFELSDLPEGSKRWNVKPPKPLLVMEASKERVEDAEVAEVFPENDEKDVTVKSADGTSLKAWPQRASVRDMTQKKPRRHDQPSSSSQEDQTARDDVITLKDIRSESAQEYQPKHSESVQEVRSGGQTSFEKQPHTQDSQTPHTTNEQMRPYQGVKYSQREVNDSQERNHQKDDGLDGERSVTAEREKAGLACHSVPARKELGLEKHWVPHNPPDFANAHAMDISDLMEAVTIDDSLVTELPDEGGQASREAVGRWGEWFIYNYLLKASTKLPSGEKIVKVWWINEEQESGGPYDITVLTEDKKTCFVEVKATSSHTKELIPISWKELKFAEENKDRYFLYRLYNAGKSLKEVQLKYLQNLVSHLNTTPTARLYLTL